MERSVRLQEASCNAVRLRSAGRFPRWLTATTLASLIACSAQTQPTASRAFRSTPPRVQPWWLLSACSATVASGWPARSLERWQVGFIYQISQGSPRTFIGNNFLYANGRPNIVGPWVAPSGTVTWDGQNGYFYGDTQFATYKDPQCANVTTKDN